MDALLLSIAARKTELDRLRPLSGDALRQLQTPDATPVHHVPRGLLGRNRGDLAQFPRHGAAPLGTREGRIR